MTSFLFCVHSSRYVQNELASIFSAHTHTHTHIYIYIYIYIYTGRPKKNATSYISLDFKRNRKPVFIIYTLLESFISQLGTMKKSQ